MLLKQTIIALSLITLIGCGESTMSTQPSPSAGKNLPNEDTSTIAISDAKHANDVFDDIFEERVALSPEWQTYLGRKTNNDKWDNLSDAFALEQLSITQQQLHRLNNLDTSHLDTQTQLSHKLLVQQLTEDVDDFKWRLYNYPVNQMFGVHSSVPSLLINQHKIDTQADAEAYIARLNAIPLYFEQLISGLTLRAELGIIAPKFVYPHVIRTSQNIISGKPFNGEKDSAIFNDFTQKLAQLTLDESTKIELITHAEQALVNSVKPSYEKLIAFLQVLESKATNDDGVWKFPQGQAFFDLALQRTTTTSLTAEDIHKIGLSEVKRIHSEMEAIKDKVKFSGNLAEFMTFMRTDKQFIYPSTEEGKARYLSEATAYIDTMKTQLDSLFITKPKADLIVKAVEPFREQAAGKAFYQQPAEDGSRPGIYYANLYDMESMPSYQMEALAYHEGLPGHHMQLAISQELTGLPKFRRFGSYTAYIEGWGLYSEFIPKEIGMYQDPYSDFGRLAMELWRACRLVVDTGIHAMKWDRQRGIDYYVNNTPNPEADAIKMVERHIVMPSQATAYKIGMMKIIELREQARFELGEQFDIKAFHDVVLKFGPVPLNVLDDNVQQWVQSVKSKA